jgi:hypothetical protein
MQMRVLVSVLKGTVAVRGKGSALKIADSKATALVEPVSLINLGGLGFAACAATPPPIINRNAKDIYPARCLTGESGELVVIGQALQHRFLPSENANRGKTNEVCNQIGLVEGPPGQ